MINRLKYTIFVILLLVICIGMAQSSNPPGTPDDKDHQSLTAIQAVVLGVVEGITEYLPISSTGHLYISERVMGIGHSDGEKGAADSYAICIQAGAILAVLSLYRKRLKEMVLGLIGANAEGRRLSINIAVAFIPAAVMGLLFEDIIKDHLFSFWPIALAWFIGGIIILFTARKVQHSESKFSKPLEHLTWKHSLLIGLAQCVALWPGMSRSLVTIIGAVLLGFSIPAAVEFSFLLGLITLGTATVYEATNSASQIVSTFGWFNPILGFVVAWVSAYIAVKWMLGYINRHGLWIFGYYRILLSLIVIAVVLLGIYKL